MRQDAIKLWLALLAVVPLVPVSGFQALLAAGRTQQVASLDRTGSARRQSAVSVPAFAVPCGARLVSMGVHTSSRASPPWSLLALLSVRSAILQMAMLAVFLLCAPALALASSMGRGSAGGGGGQPLPEEVYSPSRLSHVAGTRWFEGRPIETKGYQEYKASGNVARTKKADSATKTITVSLAGVDGFAASDKVWSGERKMQALALVSTGTLCAHMYRAYTRRGSQ